MNRAEWRTYYRQLRITQNYDMYMRCFRRSSFFKHYLMDFKLRLRATFKEIHAEIDPIIAQKIKIEEDYVLKGQRGGRPPKGRPKKIYIDFYKVGLRRGANHAFLLGGRRIDSSLVF